MLNCFGMQGLLVSLQGMTDAHSIIVDEAQKHCEKRVD